MPHVPQRPPRRLLPARLVLLLAPLAALAALGPLALPAAAQCEPSPPVRRILDRYEERSRTAHLKTDRDAAVASLDAGLAEHPDDPFLLRARVRALDLDGEPGGPLRWARAEHERHPDSPIHAVIHAGELAGRDTPAALHMLETVATEHPELPQVYAAIADLTAAGTFQDQARSRRALADFLARCPAPLAAASLDRIGRHATPEQMAQVAAAVRRRLAAADRPEPSDDAAAGAQAPPAVWSALWKIEFKSHPTAEHPAVRQQLARDLERLGQTPRAGDLDWLDVRRGGYSDLGDKAAVARIEAEILRVYPASETAEEIVRHRWEEEHPLPRPITFQNHAAFQRELSAATEDWHRRWPDDPSLLDTWFDAIEGRDTPSERVSAAADEVLAVAAREPDWYAWYNVPPVELQVAGAFVRHKIRLAEVPALVERSYGRTLARLEWELADDRFDDQRREKPRQLLTWLKTDRARTLLDYDEAVHQHTHAAEVEADLASLAPEKPYEKLDVFELRARAADLLGRKLDALVLYRAAVESEAELMAAGKRRRAAAAAAAAAATPATPATAPSVAAAAPAAAGSVPIPIEDRLDRLWHELGGTDAARGLLLAESNEAASTPAAVEAAHWEHPARPLPAFALADLGGKTWKLADLGGKAVLINVWATWCGPCRLEHPGLQRLYDALKARTDVTVLSFNVDEDPGKIAPYMQEHGYTFPAIPAREVVDAVVPTLSIPRNWIVDPHGRLQWEQLGFGGAGDWQQTMTAKLDEALKPPPSH